MDRRQFIELAAAGTATSLFGLPAYGQVKSDRIVTQ